MFFNGTSLEQGNKSSFDATRLNYGLKQLYLVLYGATPQALSFLPFFLFCAHFALSSPIVLTVLEEGMWCFPLASASHCSSSCGPVPTTLESANFLSPKEVTKLLLALSRHWQMPWVSVVVEDAQDCHHLQHWVHVPSTSCHGSSRLRVAGRAGGGGLAHGTEPGGI